MNETGNEAILRETGLQNIMGEEEWKINYWAITWAMIIKKTDKDWITDGGIAVRSWLKFELSSAKQKIF